MRSSIRYQVRYHLEHSLLPRQLSSEHGRDVIAALLHERGQLFVRLLELLGEGHGYTCPYSAEEFVLKPFIVSGSNTYPEFCVLKIDLPQPECSPLCSSIYICHDDQFGQIRYFTVEKSTDDGFMLCSWFNEGHINYGSIPSAEKNQFFRIAKIYVDYLTK